MATRTLSPPGPPATEKTTITPHASEALAREFQSLSAKWRRETALCSSVTEIALNPAYQQIIEMGKRVLPLIFGELRREPDHWFWALQAITGEDPVPEEDAGDLEAMAADWLAWADTRSCG